MKDRKVKEWILEHIEIDPQRGCWLWTRCKTALGYGRMRYQGRTQYVHRIAYDIWIGPPGDLFVCHRCDNPPCCNPDHLFLGTQTDNMRDGARKGRVTGPPTILKGDRHGMAKLKEADVYAIRASTKTNVQIAEEYGVANETISQIRLRRRWKHVL